MVKKSLVQKCTFLVDVSLSKTVQLELFRTQVHILLLLFVYCILQSQK